MTFRMIAQLWNTNTPAIVSCDADLTENYVYISMKFRTGVHVFCWEVAMVYLIVRASNQLAVNICLHVGFVYRCEEYFQFRSMFFFLLFCHFALLSMKIGTVVFQL